MLFLSKKTTIFRYFLENEGGAGGHQAPSPRDEALSLFDANLLLIVKVKKIEVPLNLFFGLVFFYTFICNRGCLILNCYMDQKCRNFFLCV